MASVQATGGEASNGIASQLDKDYNMLANLTMDIAADEHLDGLAGKKDLGCEALEGGGWGYKSGSYEITVNSGKGDGKGAKDVTSPGTMLAVTNLTNNVQLKDGFLTQTGSVLNQLQKAISQKIG